MEPDYSLIKQYVALLGTEDITLDFTDDGIAEIARMSASINENVENIGARRLHTVLERILDEISFEATDMKEGKVKIDAKYIKDHIGDLADSSDLSKFIL